MKKITLFLFLIISLNTYSQITFNKRIVLDSLPQLLTSVYPTDSCYYATGIISDSINQSVPGNVFLKFDLEGNLLFEKRITSPVKTYETWKGVMNMNSNGNLVTVGISSDTTAINRKAFFIEYNTNGDTVLYREFISPVFSTLGNPFIAPIDFIITTDGDYLFIANLHSQPTKDIGIFKIDINGNLKWAKTYGNLNQDGVSNIIQDGDNYIICGYNNTNGLGLNSAVYSLYLFSIDSLGNELWSHVAPTADNTFSGSDIIKISDGGYILTSAMFTEIINNNNYGVGSVIKLNSNLELEWHNPIYHSAHSPRNGLSDIVEKEIDTAFTAWGIQYGFNDTTYNLESWLARVSVDGDSLWSRSYTLLGFGPDYLHQIRDVRRTADGGYIMCGESNDGTPDGDRQKGWLFKTDEYGCLVPGCHLTNAITDVEDEFFQVNLYPNPTTDYLNIYISNQLKKGKGRIIDLSGKVIEEFDLGKNNTTYIIPTYHLATGIYFLNIIDEAGRRVTKEFVVQH